MSDPTVVRWPSHCDVCDEYTSTPERCSNCGHHLRPLDAPLVEVSPPPPVFTPTPFTDVAAEARANHRGVLAEVASWALAEGRSIDLDVAALAFDVLEDHRTDAGIRLDRGLVTRIMQSSLRNRASIARALMPDTWLEDLWTGLRFAVDTGRLHRDSDPEHALLEPLQCYGGLGADGRPRPEGVDVDFFCQCHFPHDPACPPGMVQISVGHEWKEPFEFVAHGHGVPRSVDVPVSAFEPLAKLARRTRAEPHMFPFFLDQYQHLGTIPAERDIPQLWLYLFLPSRRKGWPPLALDEHGGAWTAKRHRGRRRGFRWKAVDDRSAAHLCGLASWDFERARREREEMERWDWDDPDGTPELGSA